MHNLTLPILPTSHSYCTTLNFISLHHTLITQPYTSHSPYISLILSKHFLFSLHLPHIALSYSPYSPSIFLILHNPTLHIFPTLILHKPTLPILPISHSYCTTLHFLFSLYLTHIAQPYTSYSPYITLILYNPTLPILPTPHSYCTIPHLLFSLYLTHIAQP